LVRNDLLHEVRQALPRSHSPSKRTVSSGQSTATSDARLRQQAIGSRLRELFDEVVNEPIPEEFSQILREADEHDAGDGR